MSIIDVAVITVSYNTKELTAACVASLLASDHGVRVIVVDNASEDGTPDHIRERFASVDVIDSGDNLGFAKACNLGAASVSSDFVMFVNPDATVSVDAIRILREYADDHPLHGLYGGLISDSDGHIDISSARPLPSLWSMVCFGTGLSFVAKGSRRLDPEAMAHWDRTTPAEVGMLSGAMLMVRRDIWEELGGFDPRYFMYAEDADLGFRAMEAGHRPICVPAAQATHDSGAASTSDNKAFMKYRGLATYLRKNWSEPKRRLGILLLYSGIALRAIAPTKGEQSIDWRALWKRRAEWGPGY